MSFSIHRLGAAAICGLVLLTQATPPAPGQMLRRTPVMPPVFRFVPRLVRLEQGIRAREARIIADRQRLLNNLRHNRVFRLAATAAALNQSAAFNPYTSMNPYTQGTDGYPPSSYFDGGAGDLNGSSNIFDSQGRLMVSNQQAVLLREQDKRDKVRNKRHVMDEWIYERSNTPSNEQLRQQGRDLELTRARNAPPVTEVLSGQALNRLLDDLVKAQGQENQGPAVPVDPEVLKRIHTTSALTGTNVALLRRQGNLAWPAAFQDLPPQEQTPDLRREVEVFLREAMDQAAKGRKDVNLLRRLNADLNRLQAYLKRQVNEMPTSEYMDAKRYLNDLDAAVRLLERPDAAKYLDGSYTVRGATAQEVVRFMMEHGLQFAPATTGDEAAYVALQRALAAYSANVHPTVAER
jgi:hypothetical protein